MCGIVGHQGTLNSINIVLYGLAKLEYRGYDSAGISCIDATKKLITYKEKGRLKNLKSLISEKDIQANSAIGHTRWATHGKVSKENSHPHNGNGFSLVHNGIIENANSLKEEMISDKVQFSSETDTEVFAKLLDSHLNKDFPFIKAIAESFKQLKGNSAFVILEESTSNIYAVRANAPLVCGQDQQADEKYISSDPYALFGKAETLYFPDNEVICVLESTSNEIKFFDLDLNESNSYTTEKNIIIESDTGKGEFEHFMLKEIHEQPDLIRNFVNYYHSNIDIELRRPKRIYLTACGTAYYAGLVIRDYLEKMTKIPSVVEMASEFRYRDPIVSKEDLAIFVSQSGETADTLAALHLCKEKDISTLSILNVENSSIYRDSDENLPIRAGIEVGVASTKAFTLQCLTGRYLAEQLANIPKGESSEELEAKMNLLSERMDEVLKRSEEIEEIARNLYTKQGYFFTGRGEFFPVALEGALKLKEIAYVHAEGYASGELKHGPIALIDEEMVNIAYLGRNLFEKTLSNIQEISARRGIIFTIGEIDNSEVKEISDYSFKLNFDGLDELSPLLANLVGQLFSYYIAKFKGTDIDKPRNLAKSVTVE